MRRPLFFMSAGLVVLTALGLRLGWSGPDAGEAAFRESLRGMRIWVTGQVYQKDEESIYIQDCVIHKAIRTDISTNSEQRDSSEYFEEFTAGSQQFSKLICEVKNADSYFLGSKVRLSGTFMPFLSAGNAGEFDAAVYYRSLGIGGKVSDCTLLARGNEHWRVREALYDLNGCLQERLYRALPGPYAAIMEAMLLGNQENIDRDTKDLYRRNGILHILSISGMHVSIVGMGVNKILRKLGLPLPLAAFGGGVLLLAYGALTGFGLSAVRAIGMYLIRMLGEVVGRTYDMLTALGAVGCAMVLGNPYYLQNSGFLLSFSCVLGIGILYPVLVPERQRYRGNNRAAKTLWQKGAEKLREWELPGKVGDSFALSLSVTLATLPVQLSLYYEIPTFSIVLNLLVVPLLEPLMLSGIVTMIFPKTVVFEKIVCWIFDGYAFLCGCFDALPGNSWNPGCPAGWQIVVYYCVLAVVMLWRRGYKRKVCAAAEQSGGQVGRRGSWLHWMGCAALLICAIGILGVRPWQKNSVTFLDVGQGSCALVQLSSGENYLFDCGSTSRSNVGQYVLLPYLKYAGIGVLDGVFVSHPDEDHMNGVLELLECHGEEGIEVRQLILPDICEEKRGAVFGELLDRGTIVSYISCGEAWKCESARFVCLHPGENYDTEDINQASECIYVEFLERDQVQRTLLLTGDVGGQGERALLEALEKYGIKGVDVFQGAHHGSKYSNSEELLEQIHPAVTILSAGRNNWYGHPHVETLERLEAVGSRVFTTAECGMIRLEMGEKLRVRRFR